MLRILSLPLSLATELALVEGRRVLPLLPIWPALVNPPKPIRGPEIKEIFFLVTCTFALIRLCIHRATFTAGRNGTGLTKGKRTL